MVLDTKRKMKLKRGIYDLIKDAEIDTFAMAEK